MRTIKNFFEFKYKFIIQKLLWIFKKEPPFLDEFLFVSQVGTEDWILGAKAKRLSRFFQGKSSVFYSQNFKSIPNAQGYFFLHQKYYAKALRYNPFLKNKICFVMFTHPEWNKHFSIEHAYYVLKNATKTICLNKRMTLELEGAGIPQNKLSVWHLASNPDFFLPKKKRKGTTVGFCSAFYERKNPELIYQLVLKMQHIKFVLVGKDWGKFSKFHTMLNQPNFKYFEDLPYDEFPSLYHKMDVFVSPSYLEGGPVPLLEAMLSNIVPVASTTGFCPDIIQHGVNGFLFDPKKDSADYVAGLIDKAMQLEGDVRKYVVDFSWEKFGKRISDTFYAEQPFFNSKK